LLANRTIHICLFFLLAVVPLIINPTAIDYWYKPKIESVYALVIIAGSAGMFRYLFCRPPLAVHITPLTLPLFIYALSAIVSTVFSVSPRVSVHGDFLREEGVFTLLAYVVLTGIFSHLVESESRLRLLIKGLLVSSALVALYAVVQYTGFNPTEHFIPLYRLKEHRVDSTMGNPNFLGKFMVLVLPLFMACFLGATKRRAKLLLASGTVLCFAALVFSFTRASWIGFFISLLILLILSRADVSQKDKRTITAVVVCALVFTLAVGMLVSLKSEKYRGAFYGLIRDKAAGFTNVKEGMGVATRLFVWKKSFSLIAGRPLIGYGPDTHEMVMKDISLRYSRKFNDSVRVDRAHNNYLDITISQGLFGLGAYLSIVITLLVWLLRTINREGHRQKRLLYCGLFSAFSGYLINDFFIFSVVSVSPTFWSLMGLTLAIKELTRE